jgi:hypothetical protein
MGRMCMSHAKGSGSSSWGSPSCTVGVDVCAYSGEAERLDRSNVNAPIGDGERSEATLGGRLAVERGLLSARWTFEHDPVGVVEQPITDSVGEGGLADVIVPLGGRELARHDRRAAAVAILEDLEEVAPLLVLHRRQSPVLKDKDVHPGELTQELAVGAIGACEAEVVEEREARR